jgi:hypothetical protein
MPRNPDQTSEMKARAAKLKADAKRRAKETAAWIKKFSQRPLGTILGVGSGQPDWREKVRKRDRGKND